MVAPAPGSTPMMKPSTEDRPITGTISRTSSFETFMEPRRWLASRSSRRRRVVLGAQDGHQGFRQREGRHDEQQERDAVHEIDHAQREARHPLRLVRADGGEHEADDRHQQRLDHRALAGERRDSDEAQHHEREVVGRVERQRHARERRRRDEQEQRRDDAAREGRVGRDGQRLARMPRPRHRVAVERGGDGGGDARRVDQDGRCRAAEDGAVIDRRHEDDARRGLQRRRDRDHQRDGRHGSEPRQHADEGADEAAHHHEGEVLQRQRRRQADQDAVDHVTTRAATARYRRRAPASSAPRSRRRAARRRARSSTSGARRAA